LWGCGKGYRTEGVKRGQDRERIKNRWRRESEQKMGGGGGQVKGVIIKKN
jgi:hypothetical protein